MEVLLKTLCEKDTVNGDRLWARHDGSIYNPIGASTIDFLNVIGDLHVSSVNNETVENAVQLVIDYYDRKTMQFRYSPKGSKLPCITAKIISILKKLQVVFPFYEECYQMFFETQRPDGGWRCATVKIGKSPETDASNPGTTLYVLDALRHRGNNADELVAINKAVDFLLDHWITKKPLGPCEFGIGSTFMKTEYPFYRYNVFYYAYVLSFYERARQDERFVGVLNVLGSKETRTGVLIENPHKYWSRILFDQTKECPLSNGKYQELSKNVGKLTISST